MKLLAALAGTLLLTILALPLASLADTGVDINARAGGIPPWPMFRGDSGRTGNTSDNGPGSNLLLWSNNTGATPYSSPAVAGGRVFIGSTTGDNRFYCFNADTGARYWRFDTGGAVDSSPAVDLGSGLVYVGSRDGYLYCINISTGTQVWRNQTAGEIISAPLIYSGNVYIGCGDTVSGAGPYGLYCFNATTGATKWSVSNAGGAAGPAIDGGRLFSVGQNQLRCMDPMTGAFFWSASITDDGYGSPALSDGMVYVANADGRLFCFYTSNGTKAWDVSLGYVESCSSPAISNGSVYCCADAGGMNGALVKLNALTGANQWTHTVNSPPWSSPVVAGENVYFTAGMDIICLKTSDHSSVWTYYVGPNDPIGSGIGSSPAIAAGRLYVGGSDAKVYCIGTAGPNYPPAAVTLSPPDTIRDTSLWLRWSQSPDSDFAKYEVHRSLVPGFTPSPATLALNISSKTSNSTNVTGLNYSTQYYFKVRVVDSGAPAMFNDSNEVGATTTTPNGAPSGVTLYEPSEITPTSMRLSWSVNSDPDFAKYEVYKGLTSGFALVPSNLVKTITSGAENSTMVQSLLPWTNYYFKVRVCDNGTPALFNTSNEVSARSGNAPPAAVTLNTAQMAATSAYLTWSASTDDDFALYEVHASRNVSFTPGASTFITNMSNKQTTDYTVENLALAKNYYFTIRVYDLGGLYNDSNCVNGTTANTIPKPLISSPSEGDIFDTRTTISFNGTGTSDQDGDELSLYWTSSIDGALSPNAIFSRTLSEGEHKITLWANDGNGHNASAKVTITVKKAPDRAPGLLLISHRENDEVSGLVTLSGTAWDIDGNGTLTAVQVKDHKGDWKPATGTTSWTYDWNVSKLPNGKQKVSFRAFDGELYSSEVSVTVKINNIDLPPSVTITGPSAATPFSKLVTITGTATDPDSPVTKVEVSVNNGAWQTAIGTASWTFGLDTAGMRNGPHTIQVRASDGNSNSNVEWLNFTVKNGVAKPSVQEGPSPLLFVAIGVIAAVAVVAMLLMRKKKSTPAVPPAQSQMAQAPPSAAPAQQPAPQPPQDYQSPPPGPQ